MYVYVGGYSTYNSCLQTKLVCMSIGFWFVCLYVYKTLMRPCYHVCMYVLLHVIYVCVYICTFISDAYVPSYS
jgi:hypothetical protein